MSTKSVLILGGTGVMGKACCGILATMDCQVTVTSRSFHESKGNIMYIQGDSMNYSFLQKLVMTKKYDVIIDFMIYTTEEFEKRMKCFLQCTRQYIFISSARVYGEEKNYITEKTKRHLDMMENTEYLDENSYPIIKAKCEDLLFSSGKRNWTIVRPGTTYDDQRLDLANLRKEDWLRRVLMGKTLVVSKDLLCHYGTNTLGDDVAKGIISLLGKEDALGQVFHITESNSYTWQQILDFYIEVLEKNGIKTKIKVVDKCPVIILKNKREQFYNFMNYDRKFDNSKISVFCDVSNFIDARCGLANALDAFLKHPSWKEVDWRIEGIHDKVTKEWTKLKEIDGRRNKLLYLIYRFNLSWLLDAYVFVKQQR